MTDETKNILDFSLSDSTKQIIKKAFQADEKIYPIDCDFAMFRLFKPSQNLVNLEFGINSKFGMTFEVSAQFTSDGRINLPHKYFMEFKNTRGMGALTLSGIFGFSMLNNAIIAAHSLESLLIVQYGEDAKENINGLDMEFYKVDKGELNIYANDKYGLHPNRAIAVGNFGKGNLSINPTMTYNSEYLNLVSQGMISMTKFI